MDRVQGTRDPVPFLRPRRSGPLRPLPATASSDPPMSSTMSPSQAPPSMGFTLPWMPFGMQPMGIPVMMVASPSSQFGVGFSNPDGGGVGPDSEGGGFGEGSGSGGGNSTDPTLPTFRPRWPQNNMFLAEIKGYERAVAPPSTGEDGLKWIWRYRWEEVEDNDLYAGTSWGDYARRRHDNNPGMRSGATEVLAYNGCEAGNWSAAHDPDDPSSRRPFVGPLAMNLERPSDAYLPFTAVPNLATTQGVQDYSLFTDFTGEGGGAGLGWSDSMPLWTQASGDPNNESTFGRLPAVLAGQPLPIGHHGELWKAVLATGFGSTTVEFDWSDKPNVRVLMMERWLRRPPTSPSSIDWCPDCEAFDDPSRVIDVGGQDYVCTYWFFAANSRLDLPWVPSSQTATTNSLLRVYAAPGTSGQVVPPYSWQAPQ